METKCQCGLEQKEVNREIIGKWWCRLDTIIQREWI